MEVASPLPFGHSAAGNKRQFPGSTGLVDSTNRSPFTMHVESDEYLNPRSFKRRRFTADDTMTDSDSATVHASFPPVAMQQKNSSYAANGESIVIVSLVSTDFAEVVFVCRRYDVFCVLVMSGYVFNYTCYVSGFPNLCHSCCLCLSVLPCSWWTTLI
jgi:hypothetical protein